MLTYLLHLIKSKGPDRVHSPFIFDLYYHTLRNKYNHYSFKGIEKKYKRKKHNSNKIIGQSLFKIINKFKPISVLFISDYSTKNALYISQSRKKTLINLFLYNDLQSKKIITEKNITTLNLKELPSRLDNSEILILDNLSPVPHLNLSTIKKPKTIILTKTGKNGKDYWNSIMKNKNYNVFINFYYFYIAIRRKEQGKEHFLLRL